MAEVHLRRNTGRRLEYAGACQTTLDGGVTCGTVIALVATAHLFPSPRG